MTLIPVPVRLTQEQKTWLESQPPPLAVSVREAVNIMKACPPDRLHILGNIGAECGRQIRKGYAADHDDQHDQGQLACTAAAILFGKDDGWGIMKKWRKSRKRQLEIAAALVIGEVARIEREEARERLSLEGDVDALDRDR